MADIIAMFSRWAKSGLSVMFSQGISSSFDGSSSSSTEPTRRTALDDFQRITRMLPRIEAVLEDAEKREIQDRSVNLWLSELRLLAYDIDDVVDEYEYEVLRAQIEAATTEEAYSCVKHNQGDYFPAISDGMAVKIREIRERFDEIEKDRNALRLREEDGERRSANAYRPPPTSSLVDESSIIGRESDKEKIVELLLSDSKSCSNIQVSNKIAVIAIVGMGGVGKTTLAQLIYNDHRIRQHFDLLTWIHVSEDFDLMRLTKEIYQSITKIPCEEDVGFNSLQESIKKEFMKLQQRMFLVLDDVWVEKQGLWGSLQALLQGADIVKILMTTRNKKVADVIRTMNSFDLGFLSEEEGWRLFQQHALCNDENLMDIGQKIVKRCGGLPLAIKLLGSHLRFEREEDKWMRILASELWDLDPGANEILPALRLSYQRMPIHLKPCFRYFSMFPKNMIPDKNRLVWLWMAQGYIQPKIVGKSVEETGKEYFDELLERSFLQVAEFDKNSFIMHDLIFDLAVSISGKEFTTIKLEGGNQNKCMSNYVRHLVIHDQLANNEALEGNLVHPFLSKNATLRSLFYYGDRIIDYFRLPDSRGLRALHMKVHKDEPRAFQFLDSIASLKHLRFLCLSVDSLMKMGADFNNTPQHVLGPELPIRLFNSFHNLYNLQVLELDAFYEPIKLPTSINNLVNLRHLVLPRYSFMPDGISKLTGLQTLKYVIVDDGSHKCGGIGELEDLASLTGKCLIHGIRHTNDVEGVMKANLNKKGNIWKLCLNWHYDSRRSVDVDINFNNTQSVIKQEQQRSHQLVLQALRPHNRLRKLEIFNYPGIQFPLWLGDLPCLQSICISHCNELKNIEIAQLSSLRRLRVVHCPEVTALHGLGNLHRLEKLDIIKCYSLLISTEERLPSKLQSVRFKDCWRLKSITGLQNLHSLEELKLEKCPKLQLPLDEQLSTMPLVVKVTGCPGLRAWCERYGFKFIQTRIPFVASLQQLSKLKELTISSSDEITFTYGSGNLVSLETLHIYDSIESDFPMDEWIPCSLHTLHLNSCKRLGSFPPYQSLSTLRLLKIWNCKDITYLPGLQVMKSLERLEIIECPQFTLTLVQRLPSKLQFLLIDNCPRLLWLPGLQQLFSLRELRLYGCLQLMLPPLEQLPFMLHVQLEIFNCPKLVDWCRRNNLSFNNESSIALIASSSQEIKLWHEEASVLFEKIHVLDFDEAFLDSEKWPAFRVLGFYIVSSLHLQSIDFGYNFTRLEQLRIWNCSLLDDFIGLENLSTLQDVDISNCPKLDSLDFPKGLQSLAIKECNNIEFLDCYEEHLSSLKISSCSTLKYIFGLDKCQASLRILKISNCPELRMTARFFLDMLPPNNVQISACPQLEEWCQKQNVAYMNR